MDSVANSQTYQNLRDGPMADKARNEANQTRSEFSNLAASRQTPDQQTATGQNLTHYHSMFYNLLSWQNPRATAISYAVIVLSIFACRYVPIAHYGLRLTWMVLGITAAAEIVGRMIFDQGFSSKLRPKKYYTIPRETLESMMEDTEQLINFFVIEFQRIVFAENVYATIAVSLQALYTQAHAIADYLQAFATTLLTYFLIKVTPAWGLTLLFTTVAYFVPLVYISNRELIDHHLNNAGNLINQQTQQVRDMASQHTSKAMEVGQNTFKDYSSRAQEMMGQAKGKAVEKNYVSGETADKAESAVKGEQFPEAPRTEPEGPDSHAAEAGEAVPMPAQ